MLIFKNKNCINIEENDQNTNNNQESDQFNINRKGFIEAQGEVTELLPGAKFRVVLDNGQEIIASLAGKMRMHRIMLLAGDKVKVEISPYDLTKGRVVYRQ